MGLEANSAYIDYVIDTVKHGLTIIEFGAGDYSTKRLGELYKLYSIEHDVNWLKQYRTEYILAPLIDGFYDISVVTPHLPEIYSVVVIDGPPGSLQNNNTRYNFIHHLDVLSKADTIIIDDTNRVGWGEEQLCKELEKMESFKSEWFRDFTVLKVVK